MSPEDREPLPRVPGDPPGPYNVEIAELRGCWDALATTPDWLEACHLASWLLRRDWRVHQRPERVRVLDADGVAW